MSESMKPRHHLTVEEYLELEESSTVKHEYVGGDIHAMTGGSYRHNAITVNIVRKLADAADGTSCRVYVNDMKVRIEDSPFYYPDVMVVCEPLASENPVFEDKPCLLVEVISPSTEKIDRREKLQNYQRIPSLRAYIIAAQDRKWISHYFRDESGVWIRGDLVEEGKIPVPCPPGAELRVEDIYAGL
ncbi:MAG: Uma2 family endonuclease [Actinomycetota bacterium]|nr:Uma2 family endonuclease [Actinomycetota bacterium]